ncbi:MAG: cysteine desulfurase [Acidimicrobiia bacterium]|nr:cysteine desulfurase [Acidimicrobiia bacterium]
MADLRHLRQDFPILDRTVNGKRLVYLDSAATTQKPRSVIEAIDHYYRTSNANVHRGAYTLSVEATEAYENARAKVADFIGATDSDELVFTRGTTTGINFVAYGWGLNHLTEGDRIVLTGMEHHSNIVPWQLVARHTGAELAYLPINEDYEVSLDDLDTVVNSRTKIVALSGMSNVTGAFGPVAAVSAAARSVGAITVVDAAQAVPHAPLDVALLGVDFLAFSGHKMLGPTGTGGLWGRRDRLEEMEPTEGGGEMISDVGLYESTWAPIPHKFEAGTPNIAGAVGLGAAVDYLSKVGMSEVRSHERALTKYGIEQLSAVPHLTIHGPADLDNRGGVISFQLADVHPHDIATILDQEGVAVRAGHHCAKPLMRSLGVPATARASFYLYNTPEDVDALVAALHHALELFGVS